MIRNITRIALESEGYFILASHDGEEALTLSRKFSGTIHALLSDVTMPKMNGLELRQRILTERPGIKVLLMSGYVDTPLPRTAAFLPKPFTPADLQERMRKLLASPAST